MVESDRKHILIFIHSHLYRQRFSLTNRKLLPQSRIEFSYKCSNKNLKEKKNHNKNEIQLHNNVTE